MKKIIAIGSDHAGFEYKEALGTVAQKLGWEVIDKGTYSLESCDYPDFSHAVAQAVEDEKVTFGLLVCGSANGVSMTANKHPNVRAPICWNNEISVLARTHNDANILSVPARFVDMDTAIEMLESFLTTDFEGGRHQKRVEKINL